MPVDPEMLSRSRWYARSNDSEGSNKSPSRIPSVTVEARTDFHDPFFEMIQNL